MIQMGKLLRQLRKEQHLTQEQLGEGIISKSDLSRIENETKKPDIFQISALLYRLGKSAEHFEFVVSDIECGLLKLRGKIKESMLLEEFERAAEYLEQYEQQVESGKLLQSGYIKTIRQAILEKNPTPELYVPDPEVLVISEVDLLKEIRRAKGWSQEQLSDNLCARETISYIENGRTPNHKMLKKVLENRGVTLLNYYSFVVSTEFEVHELVQEYHRVLSVERNIAASLLNDLKQRIDINHPVNRQFLESSELLDRLHRKTLEPAVVMAGLEKCLRYTMPEYDGSPARIPYREEVLLLEGILKCRYLLGRNKEAKELETILVKKNEKKQKFS